MATIAVLGLGLLGSEFAENLVRKGHTVRIWNRTASKAAPLVGLGAILASSPADAVRDAERVHLILAEDPAVDAVVDALLPGLGDGVPVIDHSTNRPEGVAARSPRLRAKGVRYLHAPVFMSPANAKEASGIMLIAGPTAEVDALRPALLTMTGRLDHTSERPDHAAVLKLVGNGLLIALTGTMGDLFQVAAGAGVAADDVLRLFTGFAPPPGYLGKRLLAAGDHPASFELTMARKDVRLMIASAGGPDELQVLPALATAMDRAIAAGQGATDFAVFARR